MSIAGEARVWTSRSLAELLVGLARRAASLCVESRGPGSTEGSPRTRGLMVPELPLDPWVGSTSSRRILFGHRVAATT